MSAKVMILIISAHISERLKYVINFIESCYPNLSFKLADYSYNFSEQTDILVIEYSKTKQIEESLFMQSMGLLESTDLATINNKWNSSENCLEAFVNGSYFGSDIFSSAFYQLSRYEEYIPSPLDNFGRFASKNDSYVIAGKENEPMVDVTLNHFVNQIKNKQPSIDINTTNYTYRPTMDVDIAYNYLGRPILRAVGAFIKDIVSPKNLLNRISVLLCLKKDPAYIFNQIANDNLLYFIHVGTYGPLDKNSGLSRKEFQAFLQSLPESNIGLHPSFKSHLDLDELLAETEQLELISDKSIYQSRQHYIKMILPDTYELLSQIGIKKDFSMGWPDRPGYRAGTCHPHLFFNLKTNKETDLEIIPFSWMDAHFIFNNKTVAMTDYFIKHIQCAQKFGGCFSPIFHNNHFNTHPQLWELLNIQLDKNTKA